MYPHPHPPIHPSAASTSASSPSASANPPSLPASLPLSSLPPTSRARASSQAGPSSAATCIDPRHACTFPSRQLGGSLSVPTRAAGGRGRRRRRAPAPARTRNPGPGFSHPRPTHPRANRRDLHLDRDLVPPSRVGSPQGWRDESARPRPRDVCCICLLRAGMMRDCIVSCLSPVPVGWVRLRSARPSCGMPSLVGAGKKPRYLYPHPTLPSRRGMRTRLRRRVNVHVVVFAF